MSVELASPIEIVDVGARGGVDSRWQPFEPHISVVGFEPDPSECERLNAAAPELPYPARFLPHALASEQRDDAVLHVCNWPVASSIYEPNEAFLRDFPIARELLKVRERKAIATTTLDAALAAEALRPDFLKVDAEGAGLDVLRGGDRVLGDALALDIEVEFAEVFKGQALFADIDPYLRERGWRLLGLRRNSWRRGEPNAGGEGPGFGGQLVSADALYYHSSPIDDELDPERVLKLVVILAAYQELDFAAQLLRRPALAQLGEGERAEWERLIASANPLSSTAPGDAAGEAESRRAQADAQAPANLSTWHDPHYF